MFDPDIPNNEGCASPISMKAPEGSVVNCKFPAAVAARMQIGHFLTEIVYRALAEAMPKRVIAGSGGTPATMNVFYGKRKDGSPWHSVIISGGGYGDPLERDPELVEKDVIEGYVSLEQAREDYGVGINPKAMKVDKTATEKLRKSVKRA